MNTLLSQYGLWSIVPRFQKERIYYRRYHQYNHILLTHTDYIVYKYISKGRLPEDLMIKLVYYF